MSIIGIINAILLYQPFQMIIAQYTNIYLINLILAIIYIAATAWDKFSEINEVKEVKIEPIQFEQISEVRESVKQIQEVMTENKVKIEKKKKENRLIADLINENVISISSIENKIIDKKFISVLSYQIGFGDELSRKVKEILRNKKKFGVELHRKYFDIFDKIGFIKLAYSYPFFIIPEDNLFPNSLRDLNKLADYLMKEAQISLSEEWKEIKGLEKKYDPEYYKKIKTKANPLNFNILITKINRRDMRHKYIIKNDFNKEFTGELSTLVKLDNLNLLEPEKVKIHELISASSIKILILSIESPTDKAKILDLEETFKKSEEKGGLGVSYFYDYHNKPTARLESILATKIDNIEKVHKYANIIMKNSKDYEEDLKRLGIKIQL